MSDRRFHAVRFLRGAFRNSPWLVIALGFHVIVITLMSVLYLQRERAGRNETPTTIAVSASRDEAPVALVPPQRIEPHRIPENSAAELVSFDELAFVPTQEAVEQDLHLDIGNPTGTDDASDGERGGTSIGVGKGGHRGTGTSPFSSRNPGSGKGGKHGRSPQGQLVGTEKAVLEGLCWLVRHQGEDGSWSPLTCRERCNPRSPCIPAEAQLQPFYDEGLTGLALLAFLGSGFTSDSRNLLTDRAMGKQYVLGDVLKKGLKWLVERQKEDGSFSATRPFLYNEAIATMALSEAYGLSRNRYFKKPAQQGVDFLVAAQKVDSLNGLSGWRYGSRAELETRRAAGEIDDETYFAELWDADASVTGWVIMALKSAQISGLAVPAGVMEGGLGFVRSVSRDDGLVGYLDLAGAGAAVGGAGHEYTYHPGTMSALGMLVRTFVAHDLTDPFLEAAARQIIQDPPTISRDELSIDYYYWYYATLALNQFDGPDSPRQSGEYWNRWNKAMQEAVLELQDKSDERDTCSRGGWLRNDRWSRQGSVVYGTAINTLTLEVYYRYENAFGVR